VMTGPLGVPVKAMWAGAALAIDAANAEGGVAGRRIRLLALDDELKPDKAQANYRELLNEHKVFGFFGCVGSATTAAAAPHLQASGAPLIGGYAVADSARERTRGSAYYLRTGYGREIESLVQHLTTIGLTRIAMAHLANPGGTETLDRLKAELTKHQLTVLAAGAVNIDAGNAPEVARTLAAANPQAVIMYLGGTLGADLMQAMWALGAVPSFYGMSIVPGEVIAQKLGDRTRGLAIAQIVPFPWGEADPLLRDYQSLAGRAKQPLGYYTTEGFLAAKLLLEALRRTGRELTRAGLHATMKTFKTRLAGMELDFSGGQHTGSRFTELVQVTQGGRFVR
jgi:branched-chain amino acid transport system substrate-binding protein